MDEDAFKAAYGEVARLPCPFEKAILSRCADCGQAQRFAIAEREAVACRAPGAHAQCLDLHGRLHRNAAFVLHRSGPLEPLAHAQEMKVQCGGLLGVQRLLVPEAATAADVGALHDGLRARFGSLDALPYAEVVRAISAFQGRRRR